MRPAIDHTIALAALASPQLALDFVVSALRKHTIISRETDPWKFGLSAFSYDIVGPSVILLSQRWCCNACRDIPSPPAKSPNSYGSNVAEAACHTRMLSKI